MDSTTTKINQRNAATTASSLVQELGGEDGLDAIIGAFYFNVLNDKQLAHFFSNGNTESLRQDQRMFFAAVLGDHDQYRASYLFQAHRSLVREHQLNHTLFNAISEILASTIHQFGYPAELNQRIVVRVNALRADLLGTSI